MFLQTSESDPHRTCILPGSAPREVECFNTDPCGDPTNRPGVCRRSALMPHEAVQTGVVVLEVLNSPGLCLDSVWLQL